MVMVPRPATEDLVAAALELVEDRPARVVDVGTGSSAVAIAIAAAAERAEVWATDTSPTAIALARANITRHGLSDRVRARQGDLLDHVPRPIDVVVANLPYLPSGEPTRYPELEREPHEAVFAGGDGLGPYRRLLAQCSEWLSPDGAVLIQLHRRVLKATRENLPRLQAEVERYSAADEIRAAA
jgi:release factor glutamine methyltransferase